MDISRDLTGSSPVKRKRDDDTDTKESIPITTAAAVAEESLTDVPDTKRARIEGVNYNDMPALEQQPAHMPHGEWFKPKPAVFPENYVAHATDMDEKKGHTTATSTSAEPAAAAPAPSNYFAWVLKKAKMKAVAGSSESTYSAVMKETTGTRTRPISIAAENAQFNLTYMPAAQKLPPAMTKGSVFSLFSCLNNSEYDAKAPAAAAAATGSGQLNNFAQRNPITAPAPSLSVYRPVLGKESSVIYRPPAAAKPHQPSQSAAATTAVISRNASSDCNFAAIKDQINCLSPEQQAVLIAIMKGDNVFFSGAAGTGKSYLIKLLHLLLPKESTFFTAYSGLAGVNIGGTTLHSFAGVGLAEDSAEALAMKVDRNKEARKRWMAAKRLIFDEASMAGEEFMEKLEYVAQKVRRNTKPFGGIQLIFSGDFLQLPPVKDLKQTYESRAWKRCFKTNILLTKVFRQEGDPEFGLLLEHMRKGELSAEEEQKLIDAADNKLPPINGVIPTRLHGKRKDVATDNRRFLLELPGDSYLFDAEDTHRSEPHYKLLQKECQAAQQIELRVGAQVMLLKNYDTEKGLCNGTRGVVVDFVKVGDVTDEMLNAQLNEQVMNFLNTLAPPAQKTTPMSTCETDGFTMVNAPTANACAEKECSHTWVAGTRVLVCDWCTNYYCCVDGCFMAHQDSCQRKEPPVKSVAAAAATASSGAASSPSNSENKENVPPVRVSNPRGGYLAKDKNVPKEKRDYYLPRVRFENAEASLLTISSDKFDIQARGVEMAARRQLPLTLAYALSVHKSQSLTLTRAVINAKDMFEEGQLYVGVSRIKTYDGLKLLNFTRTEMKTNMAIVKWYEELEQETKEKVKRLLNEKDKYFSC